MQTAIGGRSATKILSLCCVRLLQGCSDFLLLWHWAEVFRRSSLSCNFDICGISHAALSNQKQRYKGSALKQGLDLNWLFHDQAQCWFLIMQYHIFNLFDLCMTSFKQISYKIYLFEISSSNQPVLRNTYIVPISTFMGFAIP